jgi:O-antigen/teichoic acid export membrane protein
MLRVPNSAGLVAVSRLLATLLTLSTAPVVARAVGPEGRGAVSAALAAFALVPIVLAFGMPLNLRRLSTSELGASFHRSARDLTLALFVPSSVVAYLLGITLFSSVDPLVQSVAAAGIAISPLSVSWMNDQSVLIAKRRFKRVAALQLMQPGVYVALIGSVWVLSTLNVASVLICYLIGSIATFVLGVLLVPLSVRGPRGSRRLFVRESLSFSGGAVAEAATNRLDQLLVVPLIGLYQSGLYSLAVTLSSLPMSFAHAIGAHYFSKYSEQGGSRQVLVDESVRVTLYISIVITGGLSIASIALVPVVFGQDFTPALNSVWVSQIGSVFMCVSYVGSMVLVSAGAGSKLTLAQLVSLVVSTAALFLIAPWRGAVGASLASLSGYLILAGVVLVLAGVKPSKMLPKKSDLRTSVRIFTR